MAESPWVDVVLLALTVPEWNPARKNLDEVRKACMRAKDVVRQILSFSRKSEIEQKSINIASVVTESLKLSRASIPTSIEIRQNIENDVDDILRDPTQIHQVMIIFCTNAAHAMENDGGNQPPRPAISATILRNSGESATEVSCTYSSALTG